MPTARENNRSDLLSLETEANEIVRAAGPHLRVERKWGHDWYVGTDHVCGVFLYQRHIVIEFERGSTLPDPTGLLEGTGKNLRHVTLRSTSDARNPALQTLLAAAVELDRVTPKRLR
jgi:hypothetical protein